MPQAPNPTTSHVHTSLGRKMFMTLMACHGTARRIYGGTPQKGAPNEHLIVLARHFLVMLYLFLIIEQIRVHARARAHARIRGRQKYGPSFVQRYVQTIGALKPKAENKFSFN